MTNANEKKINWSAFFPVSIIFAVLSLTALLLIVIPPLITAPEPTEPHPTEPSVYYIMDTYEELVSKKLSDAKEAVCSVEKVLWIRDDAEVAPAPNPECFGQTDDPSTLQWLLDDAAKERIYKLCEKKMGENMMKDKNIEMNTNEYN